MAYTKNSEYDRDEDAFDDCLDAEAVARDKAEDLYLRLGVNPRDTIKETWIDGFVTAWINKPS